MYHLLVLLSLMASNVYGVVAVTLDASMLTQFGYNNQSSGIYFFHKNIDDIEPNAFNGYTKLTFVDLLYNFLTKLDLSLFKDLVNLAILYFQGNILLTQLTNVKKSHSHY